MIPECAAYLHAHPVGELSVIVNAEWCVDSSDVSRKGVAISTIALVNKGAGTAAFRDGLECWFGTRPGAFARFLHPVEITLPRIAVTFGARLQLGDGKAGLLQI